jgi:ATP-dependent Clp protease protease subunit
MSIEHLSKIIDVHNQYSSSGPYQRYREMGLNEMLLENRIIFLDMPLDPRYVTNQGTICSVIIKSLLHLDNLKRNSDIHLYINCPGGSVDDMMAIYDTMQFLHSDLCTYCIGHAGSAAAVILAAGTKGKRYALPHSKVMIHQPIGGLSGQASDVKIYADLILKEKKTIHEILSKHTGKPIEQIAEDTERDRWMTAEEAKQYGLIDEVLHEEEEQKTKEKKNKEQNNS